MTEEEIIDLILENYYYYEHFMLENALKEHSDEKLLEVRSSDESGTLVSVSMHGKNLVNAGGYLYFNSDSDSPKKHRLPGFLKEYKVSRLRYYLFWPVVGIALVELVFILLNQWFFKS